MSVNSPFRDVTEVMQLFFFHTVFLLVNASVCLKITDNVVLTMQFWSKNKAEITT